MGNREKAIAALLAAWEDEFNAGQRIRSLEAMNLCLQFDQPIPAWAISHFCTSVTKYTDADARTLDKAFDVKRAKGLHLGNVKNLLVVPALVEIRKYGGMSIDEAFRDVAENRRMSESTVSRIYYANKPVMDTDRKKQKKK